MAFLWTPRFYLIGPIALFISPFLSGLSGRSVTAIVQQQNFQSGSLRYVPTVFTDCGGSQCSPYVGYFFYILYIHFIFPSVIRPPLRKAHIWVCKWMFKTSNLWVCGTVAYRGARPSRSVKHRGPSRSVKHRGPSRSVKHRSEKVELWQPHSGRRSCTHASIQSHPKQQCYVLCYVLVLWKYKHNTAFLCICMWILCTTNALNDQE